MTIVNLFEIPELLKDRKHVSVAQCHGCFDLLHPGHVAHLQEAKKYADTLIVTVTSDRYVRKGRGRPIFTQKQRSEMLDALKCVDYIAIVDDPDASRAIEVINPDYFIKGPDYTNGIAEYERVAAARAGAIVIYTDTPKMSSTEIIQRCAQVTEMA